MSRAQHGSIEVPLVGSIPALVELDDDHATAVLLVRPLHALDAVVGSQVAIDIATSRGLVHCDARICRVRNGDVLDLEVDGEREIIQRREYARVDALLDVTIPPDTPAFAVNISGSGAVVSRLAGLALGDPVELALQLAPFEPPIMIRGRVVRECDDDLRAVHFEQVHKADRERIVHFVFERQRLEIQRQVRHA